MIRKQEIKLVLISNMFGLLFLPFMISVGAAQQRVSAVGVDQVISEPLLQTMPVLGRFIAKESGVVATRIAERVHKMYVQVGDRVKKGDLFCAINGKNFNGHDFISSASERGATACLISENLINNKIQNFFYLFIH